MLETATALRRAVDDALSRLKAVGSGPSTQRPAPNKWSPREIIGHLIDSAANNHGRFVRAQLADEMVFSGYAQDDWVRVQAYADADWLDLIALWAGYNAHIARVMDRVPDEIAQRPRHRHNLHELSWQPVRADQPVTLAFFMDDYVGHLEHHLRQIWAMTAR